MKNIQIHISIKQTIGHDADRNNNPAPNFLSAGVGCFREALFFTKSSQRPFALLAPWGIGDFDQLLKRHGHMPTFDKKRAQHFW